MPKTKKSPNQSSFFHKDIPQMSEGYYSFGPNPNLHKFIEDHSKPYDPQTDKYQRKPFDEPIVDETSNPIFDMHPYWSKKPHDAIKRYILHYTQEGDVVLDPFMGSGSTGVAAVQMGRKFIGIEREPKYFDIAVRRIEDAQRMTDMFAHEVRDAYEMTAQQADLLEGVK